MGWVRVDVARLLGGHVSQVLTAEPFASWPVVRSEDSDPRPEVRFEFVGRGVELLCDGKGMVLAVFFKSDAAAALAGMSFASSRRDVRGRFGSPVASGAAVRIPGLGDHGPWDRFQIDGGASLHVHYRRSLDAIHLITLMHRDAMS